MTSDKYKDVFGKMNTNLEIFINQVKNQKLDLMATDMWTVKDVLCHIVFWHTNYAANYRALVLKEDPPLLEGPGHALNMDGVRSLQKYTIESLINKLHNAQKSLYDSIVVNKIPRMTYKKSTNRVYETREFLHMVEIHLNTHTLQVRRAKNGNNK